MLALILHLSRFIANFLFFEFIFIVNSLQALQELSNQQQKLLDEFRAKLISMSIFETELWKFGKIIQILINNIFSPENTSSMFNNFSVHSDQKSIQLWKTEKATRIMLI